MAVRKGAGTETSMVNITSKPVVRRVAVAEGRIRLRKASIVSIRGKNRKGDVLTVAEIAGIAAAKRTSELIPLCHQIPLTGVQVKFRIDSAGVRCMCRVEARWGTGVEMEALAAVNASLLTIWDMVKKTEKDGEGQYPFTCMSDIRVVSKEKEGSAGSP
ncbi:MAG: cyclic pyranopterin monophosphate synthase MoaC [Candidatus Thermoplasmatota archaeon]|nr:cyclic pyranopterin monophosphate synthase MoaC [Candidatus Thermoplasmatota archaeon]MCL5253111.1 cyclic pyranopterin monophosphate synthase MoaC [Candidatus Thermoplasmatota archaeon]